MANKHRGNPHRPLTSRTSKPEKQEAEAEHAENPATQHRSLELPVLSTIKNVLQSFIQEYRASNERNDRIQERNLRMARFTAWVVFVYTAVTILLWCATREANSIAQRSLLISIRPGITVFANNLSDFVVGKNARADFSIKNAGPGAAKKLSIGGELTLCSNHTIPCLEACTETSGRLPFFPIDLQVGEKWDGTKVQGPISKDQWNQFSSGNYAVQFCGHVTYSDALLNLEEFPFCYVYERVEGRWLHCPGRMSQNK